MVTVIFRQKPPLGQFIATFIMIIGYGIIAVPTGIVSAEICQAIKYQNNDEGLPALPVRLKYIVQMPNIVENVDIN